MLGVGWCAHSGLHSVAKCGTSGGSTPEETRGGEQVQAPRPLHRQGPRVCEGPRYSLVGLAAAGVTFMEQGNPRTVDVIDCRRANDLLRGAIDLHCHVNPHFRPEIHAQSAIEYARQAREAGTGAIVLKDVGLPTTGTAAIVNSLVDGIEVFRSLVLNRCNGGSNPQAVFTALRHGDSARIIFMPTGDALNHAIKRERFYAGVNPPVPREKAITIRHGGQLIGDVHEILSLIAGADRCLATAHLSPPEVMALVEATRDHGVRKIIVTHALWQMVGLSLDHLKQLAVGGRSSRLSAVCSCR